MQSNDFIAKLNTELVKYKKLTEQLENEENLKKNQNKLLQMILHRLEDNRPSNLTETNRVNN